MRSLIPCVAFAGIFGCGADLIAPTPLLVVDSFPSQGAMIAPGEVPLIALFSEAVEEDALLEATLLEETSALGIGIRDLNLSLSSFDTETLTASFRAEALDPDSTYRFTIAADALISTSGARLEADFVRRFSTGP